jgi:hypothetical protein
VRVLVVGGTGGFGRTICALLAADGHEVMAASRTMPEDTPEGVGHVVLERSSIRPRDLRPYDLVVDAAGPFQGLDQALPRAAIVAGVHYLDIADDRIFVEAIVGLDADARSASVCVVSGTSSVPALSTAVIRELLDGPGGAFDRVERVDVAISASSQAVFGRSVLQAMLSGAGRPIPGDGGISMLDAGRMHASSPHGDLDRGVLSCDVPIREGLPGRLDGVRVSFRAGSELALHNAAMRLVARMVRLRLLSSGTAAAPLASFARRLTAGSGGGRSAMAVEVRGTVEGAHVLRRWSLVAERNQGPMIPCVMVPLLARRLAAGSIDPGARSAGGMLTLGEIVGMLPTDDFSTDVRDRIEAPVYADVLGPDWDRLSPAVRSLHDITGSAVAGGHADVVRSRSPLARLVARIMGFPPAGRDVPVRVAFEVVDGRETWTRTFGDASFSSVLSKAGGEIEERFGPMRFRFRLTVEDGGIAMIPAGWSFLHVPMPAFLMPNGVARETDEDSAFRFDVPITMPFIGPVVHYRGILRMESTRHNHAVAPETRPSKTSP